MTVALMAARNVRRNVVRTILTVCAGVVAILAFVLVRTMITAWNSAADHSVKDRLITRNKVSFVIWIPQRYVDTVRQMPGVVAATTFNWFAGRDPRHLDDYFTSMAVDPASYLQVYDEVILPPDQRARWLEDRQGAVIGSDLASHLGVKVGDRFSLTGTIYAGDYTFNVDGIYTTSRRSVDRSLFLFNYAYLNDQIPEARRNLITWITAKLADPASSAETSAAIDRAFSVRDVPTNTMSERSFFLQYMATVSTMMRALDLTSGIFLIIMALVLGNAIAMGVRERTREYGVLRAIGFSSESIATSVVMEAVGIALLAAGLGIALSYPLVEGGLGRWLEENMGAFFPYFRIEHGTVAVALFLSVALGAVAGMLPARWALKTALARALRYGT